MKRLAIMSALAAILLSTSAQSQTMFTGDVKYACEAILCLSTGNRPDECAPSINRYFSIKMKRLKDTLKARENFLALCPKVDSAEVNRIVAASTQAEPENPRSEKATDVLVSLPTTIETKAEIEQKIRTLQPIWDKQVELSLAARTVAEACVAKNGLPENGFCPAEMADYHSKRLPAIDTRDEIYRLQAALKKYEQN